MQTAALGQVFGLSMGDRVEDFTAKERATLGAYEIMPPQPNQLFDTYIVLAGPKTGICMVTGRAEATRPADWARLVDQLQPILTEKYGVAKVVPNLPSYEFGGTGDLASVSLSYRQPYAYLTYTFTNALECGGELGALLEERNRQGL